MFIIGGFDAGTQYCMKGGEYQRKDLLIPVGENRLYDTETEEYLIAVDYVTVNINGEWVKKTFREAIEEEDDELPF